MKKDHLSLRLFILTIASIFIVEFGIMLTLEHLINLNHDLEDFLDALFLILIIFPIVYHFSFRSLVNQTRELKKFQLAVENSTDQIVITDTEGIILYANPATEKTTGYSVKEVMNTKAGRLWGKQMDKSYYETLWKTIKTDQKPFLGQINNKRKNGEMYIAEVNIDPVIDGGKPIYFVGIERDITREKEIDRMKTEFISLASHQLRTPLSAVKWFLEMLIDKDAGEINDQQKEFLNNAYQSNERMISLVNSLLDVSRIESGRIIIDSVPTKLADVVENVKKDIENKVKEKEQTLNVNIGEFPKVKLDPKLIRQVYLNLLTNAIKYTPKGGKISVSISRENDNIVSKISDTGYGIPAKDHNRVFQKFYRGENILKYETDGNGLGLYLVKAIVESSNGKIWFESKEGKGTTFWFSVPLTGVKPKKGEVALGT